LKENNWEDKQKIWIVRHNWKKNQINKWIKKKQRISISNELNDDKWIFLNNKKMIKANPT